MTLTLTTDPNPDPDPNLHQVLLQDRDAMNRAVEGDTVVLRLLPQPEWKLAAKRGEKLGDQATPTLVILTPYS